MLKLHCFCIVDAGRGQYYDEGKEAPGLQEVHSIVCGPLHLLGRLAGGLGPGGVQLHVRLPVRVPILQRPPVHVIEQQLSLRVPSVGSPRLLLRRRQMEGLLLQLRQLRKWHRAPNQRIHNTRTSVCMISQRLVCACGCRASTVLTLLLRMVLVVLVVAPGPGGGVVQHVISQL